MKRKYIELLKELGYKFASEKLKAMREARGEDIKEFLIAFRKRTGFTISKQAYSYLEGEDECYPSIETLLKLMNFYYTDFNFWFEPNRSQEEVKK